MASSWLKGLKDKHENQVKFICCDNAGENKKLEEKCDADGLGIIFEYTATGTPQQNAYVERAFPTLMGRARAMMNFAGFTTVTENVPKTLSKAPCLVAKRMSLTLHLLLFAQSM